MKVLLIGGGGREHALGWKIAQSSLLSTLYVQQGNPGLDSLGEPVDLDETNHADVISFCKRNHVDLVVVGPEAPLAAGISDALTGSGIACFGPSANAAKLETSKSFTKEICSKAGIPTASYGRFDRFDEASAFLRTMSAPYVVKADGLAAGKGVVIAASLVEADNAIHEMLDGKFGDAGASVVIEEFLPGEEASLFVLCDGTRSIALAGAQDHKRAFDGDKGPNTGGMGAYSPAPVLSPGVQERAMREIITPTLAQMSKDGMPYVGVLYAGLMIDQDAPKLVEYNVRFGDPECQVLMRRMESDILPFLAGAANGNLPNDDLSWRDDPCALVVMASKGYPDKYDKGSTIKGVDAADACPGVEVFHAGTQQKGDALVASGGRVLNVTATGDTLSSAVRSAYGAIDMIDWPEGFFRSDIGHRALGPSPQDSKGASVASMDRLP